MDTIRITVNGEERDFEGGTLVDLLKDLDLQPEQVAIEYNLEILKRALFPETRLAAGDRLEIVRFVQGGAEP